MGVLQNKTVLVTREKQQANVFADKIEKLGGKAQIADVLKIICTGKTNIQQMQEKLSNYDWLFFTSANGVNCFFNGLESAVKTKLNKLQIAVVGNKTNQALEQYGLTATFIPSIYNAKTMAKEFLEKYPDPGEMLLVRGSLARPELVETFSARGLDFDLLEVYKTETNKGAGEKLARLFQKAVPDYLTFTSPSAVDAFCELSTATLPEKTMVVCIGTTTEKKALTLGFSRIIVPETFTIEGMLQIMGEHAEKGGNELL